MDNIKFQRNQNKDDLRQKNQFQEKIKTKEKHSQVNLVSNNFYQEGNPQEQEQNQYNGQQKKNNFDLADQDQGNFGNNQQIIKSTQREDGTWRKEIRIKPGYKNQDEVPKYVIPQRRNQQSQTEQVYQKEKIFQAEAKQSNQSNKQIDLDYQLNDQFGKMSIQNEEVSISNIKQKSNTKNKQNKINQPEKNESLDDIQENDQHNNLEKQIRKVKKIIRQIEELEQKQEDQQNLTENQIQKISTKANQLNILEDLLFQQKELINKKETDQIIN